jgi:hypothetical protein
VGPEQFLGRVEADCASFNVMIKACVVEKSKVPVDQLSLVEFEVQTHGIKYNVAHLDVVVDDSCPVHLIHLLKHLVEDERRLLAVELQRPKHYRFFVRKQ